MAAADATQSIKLEMASEVVRTTGNRIGLLQLRVLGLACFRTGMSGYKNKAEIDEAIENINMALS